MAGRSQGLDAKLAGLDQFAVADRLRPGHVFGQIGEDVGAEAPLDLVVVGHVVGVGMRRQEVRDLDLEPLDGLDQRLDRSAAVHEHGGAAGTSATR